MIEGIYHLFFDLCQIHLNPLPQGPPHPHLLPRSNTAVNSEAFPACIITNTHRFTKRDINKKGVNTVVTRKRFP